VDEAEDGLTAVPKLETNCYDLALVDWDMPGMNGLELIRHIRSHSGIGSLPVIMVTAENRQEQISAAAEAGANDYVVKPFDAVDLQQKVRNILNG
jgi:two-component system chemotaxis response regulator CheY